jgi:hypothetical protein
VHSQSAQNWTRKPPQQTEALSCCFLSFCSNFGVFCGLCTDVGTQTYPICTLKFGVSEHLVSTQKMCSTLCPITLSFSAHSTHPVHEGCVDFFVNAVKFPINTCPLKTKTGNSNLHSHTLLCGCHNNARVWWWWLMQQRACRSTRCNRPCCRAG